MKKNEIMFLILPLLLASCEISDDIEIISEIQDDINISTFDFETPQEEVEKTDVKNQILPQSQIPQTITIRQSEIPLIITTTAVTTQQNVAPTQTEVDTTTEDIIEVADTEAEFESEFSAAVFQDEKTKDYFILLNVTPQKVYWNKIDGYDVTVGQAMDIAVPAIFEEWLTDADGMMIYMGEEGRNEISDIKINDRTVKGMYCRQYLDMDYLCPIKDDIMYFGEISDKIKNSFSRIDDGVYMEVVNQLYPENHFGNDMSVDDLDLYFETLKIDDDAITKEASENSDWDYDVPGYFVCQVGVRFRATINYIY